MSDRIEMTITMKVSTAQALSLMAMFKYWDQLASLGRSREVGFYVDGDGDFHPHCNIETSKPIPELTPEIEKFAIVSDKNGNRVYDYDGVGWYLVDDQEKKCTQKY